MEKKYWVMGWLFNFLMVSVFSQEQKGRIDGSAIPPSQAHYQQEYTFDVPLDSNQWLKQKAGLHVSFASTDALYFRTEVPQLEKESNSLESTVWKGERLNVMILIWSPDTLQQVRVEVSNLTGNKGNVVNKKNIQVNMVRYVLSNHPYGAREVSCGAGPDKDLFLMPDRFESFDRFDLPGRSVRPIWITIDVPAETAVNEYNGTIKINSEHENATLKFKLNIQHQVLPKPAEWKHRLDLWQNPWVVAWENHVQPWSAAHILLLKKHLQLYADAGGKYITTYAVHSPWSDNSYMIEGGMIEWVKRKNGDWKFDYNIFDQYVQLAIEAGIDKAITLYTPIPWGFRFRYLDEQSGNYLFATWPPDTKEFNVIWNIFLTDLKKHLEQKGWFNKTYLGINENAMDQTLAAINMIRKHSGKWKITYAGDWHKELETLLDDYSFLYGKESGVALVKQRALKGFTTTYYVCCNPAFPNNFVFSPPVEGRWMGWYTAAHGYDGFLRWAYDAWPADPLRDARHTLWPAGDCFLVYPGGNSCIRFEKMREGIVDYEKIRILKTKTARSTDKSVQQMSRDLDQLLQKILVEKDFNTKDITEDLQRGKKIINKLSEKLASGKS